MNVIVSVLEILVFGLEGVPNLFVVVVRRVIVLAIGSKKSQRDETYVCMTFIFPNNKKYLLHYC